MTTKDQQFQIAAEMISAETRILIESIDKQEANGTLSASAAFGHRHRVNRSHDRRIDALMQEMFGAPNAAADLMMDIAFSSVEATQ